MRALPAALQTDIARHGMRNSHLTAIAPAGTISLLAGNVSSGVEPVYGEIRNEQPNDGRWLSPEDFIERRRVAFLGSQLRKKLFQGRPAVGETIRIDGMRFTVVGTMDRKMQMSNYFTSDDECVFIPYTTAGDLWDTRYSLVTVVLAGFGRAAAEVGAVIIVGGNIEGVTRVMTTAISLETSKGDLPLALGLGLILVAVVFLINAAAQIIKTAAVRRYG